jgi:heme/copper-type cytochrome/quinol oxidase subunit 3
MKISLITFLVLSFLLFGSCFKSYSQEINTPKVDPSNYNVEYNQLIKKSKHAKFAATTLELTGITLSAVGTGMFAVGVLSSSGSAAGHTVSQSNQNLQNVGLILLGTGILASVSSIFLHIRSNKLRAQARKLKMNLNTSSVSMPQSGIKSVSVPQLQVGLSLSF